MAERARERAHEAPESTTEPGFALAALGALYASIVAAIVIALLDTDLGRELAADLDAPVRALIAVPVLILSALVFVISVVALVLPDQRRRLLGVAGIAGWLIPAWLTIAAVVIASAVFILGRLD